MGCWDLFCFICGNPCWNGLRGLRDPRESKYNWMGKCVLLLCNNKIVKHCKEVSCNDTFYSKNKLLIANDINNRYFSYFDQSFHNHGLFIHESCYKFVYLALGIKLKYSDVPIREVKQYSYKYVDVDYKPISNYWGQYMDYEKIFQENMEYILQNPLKSNALNIKRLKHILSQLKLKKGRMGPTCSASFYKKGDIKIGNDNNFWIIKNGKWCKINIEILEKTYDIPTNKKTRITKKEKILDQLPQIGEYSTKLLYIKSFEHKKNYDSFKIIGTANEIKHLDHNLGF